MDLKPVMSALSQPNRMDIPLSNTSIATKDTLPTGDTLAIGIDGMLNGLFAKTRMLLAEQQVLLQSLPPQIKTAAEQILQNALPDISTLRSGLVPLVNSRRIATDSLAQLAQKLQVIASAIPSSPDNSAELSAEIKRFNQQVTSILAQLDLDAHEIDPTLLQQAREKIQSAMSDILRQAATNLTEQKSSSAEVVIPQFIRQAADKLNLPELSQLWLLNDMDFGALNDSSHPAILMQHTAARTVAESVNPAEQMIELRRFAQQVTNILTKLTLNPIDIDPAVIQQAREQIQTTMPDILRQVAATVVAAQQSSSGDATIPLAIRQAADKLGLPELLQLWPLYDLEMVTFHDNTPATMLEQHAATVRTLAESVNRAFQTLSDDQGQAVLFTLQMPFNGEPAKPKPIHIHVFHEKGQSKTDGAESKTDTWVKITLQPEHTGQVDTIFHLYGEDILDIKVVFADKQASQLFNKNVSLIREACNDFPFMLREISITTSKSTGDKNHE